MKNSYLYLLIVAYITSIGVLYSQQYSIEGQLNLDLSNNVYYSQLDNYIGFTLGINLPVVDDIIHINPSLKYFSTKINESRSRLAEECSNKALEIGVKLKYHPFERVSLHIINALPYVGIKLGYNIYNYVSGTSDYFQVGEYSNILFDELKKDIIIGPIIGIKLVPKLEKVQFVFELDYQIRRPVLNYTIDKFNTSQKYNKQLNLDNLFLNLGILVNL